jgi:hypothetical protein
VTRGITKMAVRTLKAFAVNVEDYHLMEFLKGQIIEDERIIKLLHDLDCPVVDAEDKLTSTCERCSQVFNSLPNRVKALQVKASAIGVTQGLQYFVFRQGEFVHENLIEAVLATKEPVAWVSAIKCPNPSCGHVYL